MKFAPCRRTISSKEEIRSNEDLSTLRGDIYKEDMLHTIYVSKGVAGASKSEISARVRRTSKISSTITVR
jgi:hypothetical protein